MTDPIFRCPHCQGEIHLSESLAAPLLAKTRAHYEKALLEQTEKISFHEKEAKRAQETLEEKLKAQFVADLEKERKTLEEKARTDAKSALAQEISEKDRNLSDLAFRLKHQEEKLAEAQKAQADFLKKERLLADAQRELDLTVEKRVQENISSIRENAKKEAEDLLKLKVMEKDQTILSMQKNIEALKKKAEQGSEQLQGEVLELELENALAAKFPFDLLEPVPKGEFGGDVLERVRNSTGQVCGTILWETKRTKAFSPAWLAKLREDQRAAKADIAVLVSYTLPKEIENFDLQDGIWVVSPRVFLPVATMLRASLIELFQSKAAAHGQSTKTDLIYQYLTGPRFRQRIEAIVEAFSTMQEDLDKEKRQITKQWEKRAMQIERVMTSTVGMYGDLQGIAGKSLQEIEGLEFSLTALPNA